ncbi:DUF6875 domain-containing protein [Rugamonas rubra]|nr:hypothetical protein [Rugamonas rubra]
MMTQTELHTQAPRASCPPAEHGVAAAPPKPPGPRLMRASEVDRDYPADAPLAEVLAWTRAFLARTHPDLGRKGPVCPFVPIALAQDSIWLAEINDPEPSLESIAAVIATYRDLFLATPPTDGPDSINKAFMVLFPNLGAEGAAVVDQVQYRLKRDFVDMGLMLGEFHALNESAGLRNPDFRPLRSPIPILAIRHMVDSDLPFLLRDGYPAEARAAFLRAYLYRLAGSLAPAKLEQAIDGVVEAEIERRAGHALRGEGAALAALAALPLPPDLAGELPPAAPAATVCEGVRP